MFRKLVLLVVATILSGAQALSLRSSTTVYSNASQTTTTTSSSSRISYSTPSICCFVVQHTVTENYWPISSPLAVIHEVNLTSVTLSITPYRNGTVTNAITNVYTTNITSFSTVDAAWNPISFYDNPVPQLITQEATELPHNVTAIITGGITIQSPAAFLVYSTIQIITAAPVTNADGFVECGTRSSWNGPGLNPEIQPTFQFINSNAEAYFGGYGLAGDNQEATSTETFTGTFAPSGTQITNTITQNLNATYYTNSQGSTIDDSTLETRFATQIVLTTPFVFVPERGTTGATARTTCYESDETELYGYVPQTLVDLLGSDRYYLSQYPNLGSCLPGGPSMIRRQTCFSYTETAHITYHTPVGGDLQRTTVITVTPPADPHMTGSQAEPQSDINPPIQTKTNPPSGGAEECTDVITCAVFNSGAGGDTIPTSRTPGADQQTAVGGTLLVPTNIGRPTGQPSVGAIINSIVGGGGQGESGGTGPLITPPSGGQPIPVSIGSTTLISGTPVFVIPSVTTVPAADLPSGLGSTTLINGTPFVVIQPTTIPIPGSQTSIPVLPGEITIISGSTFDIFTGATTVQVNSELPLVGITTVISGTAMVVLPGATTVPVLGATPTYVQASGAERSRGSLIGFGFELFRGFVGRFR